MRRTIRCGRPRTGGARTTRPCRLRWAGTAEPTPPAARSRPRAAMARCQTGVAAEPTHWASDSRSPSRLSPRRDRHRRGQTRSGVAGAAKGLTGHDGDLGLLERHLGQVEGRADGLAPMVCRSRPRTRGRRRTRPAGKTLDPVHARQQLMHRLATAIESSRIISTAVRSPVTAASAARWATLSTFEV